MIWDPLESTLRRLGLRGKSLRPRFEAYLEMLLEWNRRFNLTSIRKPADIVVRHFCDSLELLAVWQPPEGAGLVDVGSGAGFPGVPVALAAPGATVTVVEAKGKTVRFLRELSSNLAVANLQVLHERVERVGRGPHRGKFDAGLARAVAMPSVALEYVLPLLKKDGAFFLWASRNFEPSSVAGALEALGGRLGRVHRVVLASTRYERQIVEFRKRKATPERYPRRPGQPQKRPL